MLKGWVVRLERERGGREREREIEMEGGDIERWRER